MKILSIQDLTMGFHTINGYNEVLHGISLDVYHGEKVALVGESGSGKSITVRAVLGIADYPNAKIGGTILFEGNNTLRYTDKDWYGIRGNDITMIFQDPTNALNPTYKVGKQILDAMMASGKYKNKAACKPLILAEMQKISIPEPERIFQSYGFQLSGGLNQRISILMALLSNPKLLLADEPGTALDVTVQAQTLALMDTLITQRNASCLFISHNLGVVRNFADVVYVIHKGRIVESGTTKSLFTTPQHPYTKALIQAVPTLNPMDLTAITVDEQSFYKAPYTHSCMIERQAQHAK